MKKQHIAILLLATLIAPLSVTAEEDSRDQALLDESTYRTDIEELVITATIEEWRRVALEQEKWRRDHFQLNDELQPSRLEWFPLYNKDERDNYLQVRDRKDEKPEFKFFEWRF